MPLPRITIELSKITHNTQVLTTACNNAGIQVVGVVKACLGNFDVAQAMLIGGVRTIADSRLANLEHLRGLGVRVMMLRQPMAWETERVVKLTDVCLVSEFAAIERLAAAAKKVKKKYNVIIMVETGDLREGVMPDELKKLARQVRELDRINIEGIGTNVACLQGVPPTSEMLELLVEKAVQLREDMGFDIPVVSGGNSSAWKLLESGLIPQEVNQFRLGEAILLGQETVNFDPIPGTHQDAFVLEAEVIESKTKPVGDASFKRAILAIGTQDICTGILKPSDKAIKVMRRSSDHLVLDITESTQDYKVGDSISFIPGYEALLAAMTSPFVEKVFVP